MPNKKVNPTPKDDHIPIVGEVPDQTTTSNVDTIDNSQPVAQASKQLSALDQLRLENHALREQAARALADYQNLERRQREERTQTIEFAKQQVFADLLQPLEHLDLAAKSLKDQGLDMVVKQFWETLQDKGLTMTSPQGQAFDAQTMEAIEKVGDGETVQEVVAPGFMLGTHVLRPAKVKVG